MCLIPILLSSLGIKSMNHFIATRIKIIIDGLWRIEISRDNFCNSANHENSSYLKWSNSWFLNLHDLSLFITNCSYESTIIALIVYPKTVKFGWSYFKFIFILINFLNKLPIFDVVFMQQVQSAYEYRKLKKKYDLLYHVTLEAHFSTLSKSKLYLNHNRTMNGIILK